MTETFDSDGVRGLLDRPVTPNGGGVALAHGAGGNANAPVLVRMGAALAAAGYLVLRYDLPFRQQRAKGPPYPAIAARDRQGVAQAVAVLRGMCQGRVFAGGHSYGGRQTAMAAAEGLVRADGLVLLSYPLHPPGRPDQRRTTFFAEWKTPAIFIHGSADSFGREPEMRAALALISAPTELVMMEGAGHDLRRGDIAAPALAWMAGLG